MCLAEALLRIPDAGTMDALIADKLNSADWERHLGKDSSLFVNASTWGLMLTGNCCTRGGTTLLRCKTCCVNCWAGWNSQYCGLR